MLALVGLWQLENYRGGKILEDALARLASHPGPVGYRSSSEVIPEDDDNFFAAPLVSSLVDFELDPDTGLHFLRDRVIYRQPHERARADKLSLPVDEMMRLSNGSIQYSARRYHHFENDLKVWAHCYRNISSLEYSDIPPSEMVLGAMTELAGDEIEAFESATKRSASYAPTIQLTEKEQWTGEFSSLLYTSSKVTQFFSLRMVAALHAGDLDVYRASFEVCEKIELGILRQLNEDALLISQSTTSTLLDSIWLGIEQGAFSEDDLKWLYDKLDEKKFASFIEGTIAEAAEVDALRFSKVRGNRRSTDWLLFYGISTDPGVRPWICRVCPDGWVDGNAGTKINWICDEILDPWNRRDFSGFSSAASRFPNFTKPSDFLLFTELHGEIWFQLRSAELYVRKSHAELACLLELYRLRHGNFPQTLEELCPEFIASVPIDPFDGLAMKYRSDGGTYSIYSVGFDLIDDGGGQDRHLGHWGNLEVGDWAWHRDMGEEIEGMTKRMERIFFRIAMEEKAGGAVSETAFEKAWTDKSVKIQAEKKSSDEKRREEIIRRQFERIKGRQ